MNKITGDKITTNRLNQLQGDMTLEAFSDKVGIGKSTLHNYLHGRDMKLSMAKKVCKGTGADPSWLMGLTNTNKGMSKALLLVKINELECVSANMLSTASVLKEGM